jgi:hypothetical protein
MRTVKIVATSLLIILLAGCLMPMVEASTLSTENGTTNVSGGGHSVLKKFRTNDRTGQDGTYLGFALTKNSSSGADQFRVMILDENNFARFESSSSYVAFDTKDSIFGIAIGLVGGFQTDSVYYMVIDNAHSTNELVVDYTTSLTNGNPLPLAPNIDPILIVAIIAAILAVLMIVVIVLFKNKRAGPPAPPMPPAQNQPPR